MVSGEPSPAYVPDERTSPAVAIGAAMARAVIAAELYRLTGELPAYVPRGCDSPPRVGVSERR